MRSIAVDENYDIQLTGARNLAMAVDKEAVRQGALTTTYMLYGEFPYDTTRGVQYMETLFQRKDPYSFEASLRGELAHVPNVTNITALRMLQTGDTLQYEVTIESAFGTVTL